jgi:hypothetical protein
LPRNNLRISTMIMSLHLKEILWSRRSVVKLLSICIFSHHL